MRRDVPSGKSEDEVGEHAQFSPMDESGEWTIYKMEPTGVLSLAAPDANDSGDGFQNPNDFGKCAFANIIADIKETVHRRQTLHKAEKSLTLQIKSKEKEAAIYRLRSGGKKLPKGRFPVPNKVDIAAVKDIYPQLYAARAQIRPDRKDYEKRLEALAMLLPVAEWWTDIPGLGLLGLALIVGIAGDVAKTDTSYQNPYKLTKNLGIAPRYCYPKSKDGKHMVPRQRLSTVLMIVDSLLRKNDGKYRALYLEEKRRQVALNPEFDKGFDPETATGASMHCDRKAKRVVAKQLVIDLWTAWQEATLGLKPMMKMPLAAE